ncbi:helix-turn-helix domain-containing protein [Lysinibacillus sphaericus]|uniref:helix-turn-helix domain-containing protein n=1 Tax=Lysinibacillus sphaericus TaxID=1421 RepID=UPI00248C8EE0|nr:helix-turn-helix domain-containing protein [Lysinibacillus sphaericus]
MAEKFVRNRGESMYNFLDRFTLQKVQLLDHIHNEKRFFSSQELAKKMDLSERTILKIVKELSSDLEKFDEAILLNELKQKQFKLDYKDYFSIKTIERFYLQNSLAYKIFNDIFYNKLVDFNMFIIENFTSQASIYRQINKIKPLLNEFQLKYTSQDFITLEGSEKQFRYFYYLFYWNSCWGETWPFLGISREEIVEIIKDYNREFQISVLYLLAICLIRAKMGFVIEDDVAYTRYTEHHYQFEKFSQTFSVLFKKFTNLNDEAIEKEIKFSFSFLESQHRYEKSESSISLMMNFGQYHNQELFVQATLYWMEKFRKFFSITLDIEEYGVLFVNLLNLHYHTLNFSGPAFLFKEDLYKKRFDCHATIQIEIMNQFYDYLLENEEFYKVFERRELLIGRYHRLLKQSIDVLKRSTIKIKIYSLIHDVHYLFDKVKRVFTHVDYCTKDEEAELIITDRLYLNIAKDKEDIFVWDSIPGREDFFRLGTRLQKIYFTKEQQPDQLLLKTLLSQV